MYHTPPSTSIWSVQNPEQFHSHLFGALVPRPISWEWVVGTWLVTDLLDLPLWSWQKAPLVCNVVLCSFYRFDLLGNFVFILSKPRRECWMILFHNCVFCPAIILPFFPLSLRPSVCPHFSTVLFKGKVAVWIIRGPIKLYILRIQINLAISAEQRDSRMGQVYNLPLCLSPNYLQFKWSSTRFFPNAYK